MILPLRGFPSHFGVSTSQFPNLRGVFNHRLLCTDTFRATTVHLSVLVYLQDTRKSQVTPLAPRLQSWLPAARSLPALDS